MANLAIWICIIAAVLIVLNTISEINNDNDNNE